MTIDRSGSAEVTLPSDLEIRIVREFDAPADLVFEVWTNPEHIRNWWGWESDPMTICEFDLRVGGRWRFVAQNEEYGEVAFHGECLDIERPHRLVSTEVFEPYPDSKAVNTLTLEEEDGVTTMTVVVRHETTEVRDAHVQSGMESGLQHSLDRVDRVLASIRERV